MSANEKRDQNLTKYAREFAESIINSAIHILRKESEKSNPVSDAFGICVEKTEDFNNSTIEHQEKLDGRETGDNLGGHLKADEEKTVEHVGLNQLLEQQEHEPDEAEAVNQSTEQYLTKDKEKSKEQMNTVNTPDSNGQVESVEKLLEEDKTEFQGFLNREQISDSDQPGELERTQQLEDHSGDFKKTEGKSVEDSPIETAEETAACPTGPSTVRGLNSSQSAISTAEEKSDKETENLENKKEVKSSFETKETNTHNPQQGSFERISVRLIVGIIMSSTLV